ncbi:hypothetical protein GCM10022254_72710 [Actinomadura meridiana]|uniref:Peptidase M48 domain-containing protein n=1 Tax=Actinomadura meridiana TaxID=559626 RepID=A0ABP8CR68_9ACTN
MTKTTRSTSAHTRQTDTKPLADFEDFMRTGQPGRGRRGALIPTAPLVLLPVGVGIADLLNALPYSMGTVLSGVLAVFVVGGIVLAERNAHRSGPPGVDWASADAYRHRLMADQSPEIRAVLSSVQRTIRNRFRAADVVHLYAMRPEPQHEQTCTIDTGGCQCAPLRLSAALIPYRRHPILMFGERLLAEPKAAAFVLAHEAHHARRGSRTPHRLLGAPLLAGWLALGLTMPPHLLILVAPAVWVVVTATQWADELVADVVAARAVGPDVARCYWALVRSARPRPRGVSGALTAVGWLFSPHPPFSVRAALTTRIPSRTPGSSGSPRT